LRRSRLSLAVALAVASSAAVVAVPSVAAAAPKNVTVQLLAMNDFHGRITAQPNPGDGQLLTSPGLDGVYGKVTNNVNDDESINVGGAANIAATVDRLRSQFYDGVDGPKASFFVGAGDLVSASPFESSRCSTRWGSTSPPWATTSSTAARRSSAASRRRPTAHSPTT
jgi:5'-nucleotidase